MATLPVETAMAADTEVAAVMNVTTATPATGKAVDTDGAKPWQRTKKFAVAATRDLSRHLPAQ
jgi:hypothetical protein